MNGQFGYNSDLSRDQIDEALYQLSQLMVQEDQQRTGSVLENEDDILHSIQELAEEVQQINIPQMKGVNSQQPKLSHQQFSQIITRIYDKHQQALSKLESMKFDQLKNESFRPQISEQSKKIIQRKIESGEYLPIQQRVDQIQANKKDRYELAQRQKTVNEKLQEQGSYTFRPNAQSQVYQDPRSVDEFLDQVDYFIKKKNHHIQVGQQQQLNKELEGVTFKPQVNPNSERIVSQSKALNTSVQERLQRSLMMKQLKEKKLIEEEMKKLTFKPQLNTNSVRLVKKNETINESLQTSTFDRLHNGLHQQKKFRSKQKSQRKNSTGLAQSMDFQFLNVLATNQNIQNINTLKQSIHTSHTPPPKQNEKSRQKFKTPPPPKHISPPKNLLQPPKYNEIVYTPNLKFIVDLLEHKKY